MVFLAATDFSTRSNRAMRQAGLLAQSRGARLFLTHVVEDEQPEALVVLEEREAERILTEQISTMPELQGVQCRPLVIRGDPFDGILRAAADVNADLIVMGSHRRQLLRDVFVGTTVERVIRTGQFPVLMVNNEAQRRYESVVAAADMSEPSAKALRSAKELGLLSGNRPTLVHAFVPLWKGKMYIANVDQASMDEYVESERKDRIQELAMFLTNNEFDPKEWNPYVEEGDPIRVISRAIAVMLPDLLIMGTHGRTGLLKQLLGSVAEQALRSLKVDILAVPPSRQ